LFSERNLTVKRPGDGISPMEWFYILGQRASRDYCIDEKIVIEKMD
jgi:N,N'-diacetyllegionaminate synthase